MKRTVFGHCANVVNNCLGRVGLTVSKLPERNTLERHVRSLLTSFDVQCVLDVGAHHGEFAGMLRDLGYTGRIVSFEPTEESFAALEESARKDPRWELHKLCLGDEDGQVEIRKFAGTTFNSLHSPTEYGLQGRFALDLNEAGTETVPIRQLGTLLPELGIDPAKDRTYLKIDTQGHDVNVLRGARPFLQDICAVQSELSGLRLYQEVPTIGEALEVYRELGFLPVGFYSVNCEADNMTVVEWDCLFTRAPESYLRKG